MSAKYIRCPECDSKSYNPGDIKNRYCARCKKITRGNVFED